MVRLCLVVVSHGHLRFSYTPVGGVVRLVVETECAGRGWSGRLVKELIAAEDAEVAVLWRADL